MLMLNFAKISRLHRLATFAVCGILLSTASIKTEDSSVLAQEIKPTTTPFLISQTRELRAESGPDDRGRWRFYKPDNVSEDAMQAEGCTNVGVSGVSWRCPRQKIKVDVDNDFRSRDSRYDDSGYGAYRRELRAESGPDDRGRWRFYKPDNVSENAMQAEGCTNVGVSGASWRCPRQKIKVDVDNDSRSRDSRYDDSGYGAYRRELRAESGPDDRGRWRFYKPDNVSEDAMQAEGCTNVGVSGASWRCPRQKIKVEVDN